MPLLAIILSMTFILMSAAPLCAEPAPEQAEAVDAGGESAGEVGKGESGTFIDTAHAAISGTVLGTANWLDNFFTDPRAEIESSETRIKVRFSYLLEDEENPDYDADANFRLDLPLLEKKLHLLIDGDPQDEDDEDQLENFVGRDQPRSEVSPSERDFSASLRYFLRQTLYQNISIRSGIRWRDGMPVLFVEPRYRQTIPFEPWQLRFTQRFYQFSDGLSGIRTTFDFERELRRPFFFRSTADGLWESDEHGYFYRFVFSLYQRFSPRRVMIYNWGNHFRTRPEHELDSVVLSVRYRQRIMRDWLFYEILPQVAFPEDRDYTATPALLLRLEMIFGHYPDLPAPPD